jgi:PAS domain S-box-containing protein
LDGTEQGELEQTATRPAVTAESSGVVRPRETLPEVLQQIVDDGRRLLQVDVAIVYLAEPLDGKYWSYDCGLSPEAHAESEIEPVRMEQGMTGLAMRTGRVVVTDDYTNDDRFWDPEARRVRAEGLGATSVVAVPMFGAAGPLGVMCVLDRRHRTFTEFELALLRAFAAHAALAIENARLSRDLVAAEARYRYLVEGSPDVVWSVDEQLRFTFVNATGARLLGWTAEEMIGQDSEIVHHPSTDEEIHRQLTALMEHPENGALFRCNLRHRDGHAVPVELHMVGQVVDGKFAGGHGNVHDTTERDRLERELRAQAAELAASHERAHLAQELHDSVTQALFGMTLTSRVAEKLIFDDPAAAAEKIYQCRELAQEALTEMRSLIFEMRPGSLAEDGLVAALRKHVAAVGGRTGLPIVLEVDEPLEGVSPGLEEALYRVCQEALHNVVKHAKAHEVRIGLRREGDWLSLSVGDDGVGFDSEAAAANGNSHLGLAGMRSRVERFGGRMEVESAPGKGTQLRATVPLDVDGAK